ncbi:MAG: ATP-binding cassette domain-containing protein, partial [Planctomycetales bacterium]
MTLIDIQNVWRSYGKVQALRGVDLQLESGPIGLVGNNGAGKSTLLKILLGILRPDAKPPKNAPGDSNRSAEQLAMRVNVLGQDVRQSSDALR